jgi:hypothetical protein
MATIIKPKIQKRENNNPIATLLARDVVRNSMFQGCQSVGMLVYQIVSVTGNMNIIVRSNFKQPSLEWYPTKFVFVTLSQFEYNKLKNVIKRSTSYS